MKVVISDTNIFIDLLNVDLLDTFLKLPLEVHTTDFIIYELREEQVEVITEKINDKKITLNEANEEEYTEILEQMKERESLSLDDHSVYYYAKKLSATILTGDRAFRNFAEEKHIEVRGILWVLDEIITNELLNKTEMVSKLTCLMETNKRLPSDECERRLEKWKSKK